VKNNGTWLVVPESRVLYFASEGSLTRLVGEGAKYWMDPGLGELEPRLDPLRFFRISRGKASRASWFNHLLVASTGFPEPLPLAELRLGRRTARIFPLFAPPQKN
jgi:hypothetical protein